MIVIVDFGSQTAHLIGRRMRDLGVAVTYVDPEIALAEIKRLHPSGIIFSGGPSSVYEKGAPTVSKNIFSLGIPILGICYGWQIMAKLLGGTVKSGQKEYGAAQITFTENLFKLKKKSCTVIMSHGDTVSKLPLGFKVIGTTPSVPYAAVVREKEQLYGLLFHPEADHTEQGTELLKYFAQDICGEKLAPISLEPEPIIKEIRETVGKERIICAVSGGVDSTVAAVMIDRAVGTQLIPVYIDSGLMRPYMTERVKKLFAEHISAKLVVVDARARFRQSLKGVTDPELKRKAIGRLYVELFAEEAKKYKPVKYLGQGTIYSDVIESKGSLHASSIKSHHNVGGLPQELGFTLVEPLRTFYKDEVRMIGRKLGLAEEFVQEQPFPGPGYAIRIRGEVTAKRLEQAMQADQIVIEELKKAGLYERFFQCFAIMTGAYSTAVKGDARVFAEVVAIRAYESKDVMTSEWARIPYEVLASMSSRIVNEVPEVSRVVYDITSKPPATMEWE